MADALYGLKTKLADLRGTVIPNSPRDIGNLITADIAKWAWVIKFAGIRVE